MSKKWKSLCQVHSSYSYWHSLRQSNSHVTLRNTTNTATLMGGLLHGACQFALFTPAQQRHWFSVHFLQKFIVKSTFATEIAEHIFIYFFFFLSFCHVTRLGENTCPELPCKYESSTILQRLSTSFIPQLLWILRVFIRNSLSEFNGDKSVNHHKAANRIDAKMQLLLIVNTLQLVPSVINTLQQAEISSLKQQFWMWYIHYN